MTAAANRLASCEQEVQDVMVAVIAASTTWGANSSSGCSSSSSSAAARLGQALKTAADTAVTNRRTLRQGEYVW